MLSNSHECVEAQNPAVADIRAMQAADPAASKSRKEAGLIINCGQTKVIKLEKAGLLHRYTDGSSVRITTASIYEYLIACAAAPPRKVREPAAKFRHAKKAPRPRTEAELEGLRKGNAKRAAEAQARRAAAKGAENTG
jgi:hypothetical protein